jgi:hypothetical protein
MMLTLLADPRGGRALIAENRAPLQRQRRPAVITANQAPDHAMIDRLRVRH